MALILDGKVVAAKVQAAVAEGVAALRRDGVVPTLAVVLVGEDPASKVYVGGKRRACQAGQGQGLHGTFSCVLNATPNNRRNTANGRDRLQQQGSPNGEGPGR